MPDALRLVPWLLVPVIALLFLNLRLSRKLRYPHDLLEAGSRRGMASFLFRNVRAHYDLLLDAVMALVLAFAIRPPVSSRPAAVVIEGSRAMLAGFAEDRPLYKALMRIQTDPILKQAAPFLLAFDPALGRTRLVPLGPYLSGSDVEASIHALKEAFTFFSPDPGALAELRAQGYGAVTLLSDQRRIVPSGFQVIELGFAVTSAAYPSSVRFDATTETWRVALVESGPRMPLGVSAWNPEERQFFRLAPSRYVVEEGGAGRVVRFPAPGRYLLTLKAPYGFEDLDFPLVLPARNVAAVASGPFSEKVLSVFPEIDTVRKPEWALVDQGQRIPGATHRITTALVPAPATHILDPVLTGGLPVAVGWEKGLDLALAPASLANEDLVLAYDHWLSRRSPAFVPAGRDPGQSGRPVGTSFLIGTEAEPVPWVPDPSQFFDQRPLETLCLPPPATLRWPWLVALLVLALVKCLVWVRLTGRSLWARN